MYPNDALVALLRLPAKICPNTQDRPSAKAAVFMLHLNQRMAGRKGFPWWHPPGHLCSWPTLCGLEPFRSRNKTAQLVETTPETNCTHLNVLLLGSDKCWSSELGPAVLRKTDFFSASRLRQQSEGMVTLALLPLPLPWDLSWNHAKELIQATNNIGQ